MRRHIQRDCHIRAHPASQSQQPFFSKLLPQGPDPRTRRPARHVSPPCFFTSQVESGVVLALLPNKPTQLTLMWIVFFFFFFLPTAVQVTTFTKTSGKQSEPTASSTAPKHTNSLCWLVHYTILDIHFHS